MTETVEVVENVKREFKLVLIGDNGVGKSVSPIFGLVKA